MIELPDNGAVAPDLYRQSSNTARGRNNLLQEGDSEASIIFNDVHLNYILFPPQIHIRI